MLEAAKVRTKNKNFTFKKSVLQPKFGVAARLDQTSATKTASDKDAQGKGEKKKREKAEKGGKIRDQNIQKKKK